MGKKVIVATLENFDGLAEAVAENLKAKRYYQDQAFDVVAIKGDTVVIKSARHNEKDTFEVNLNNVRLFEKLGDDYKVYEPEIEETSTIKEKGE